MCSQNSACTLTLSSQYTQKEGLWLYDGAATVRGRHEAQQTCPHEVTLVLAHEAALKSGSVAAACPAGLEAEILCC